MGACLSISALHRKRNSKVGVNYEMIKVGDGPSENSTLLDIKPYVKTNTKTHESSSSGAFTEEQVQAGSMSRSTSQTYELGSISGSTSQAFEPEGVMVDVVEHNSPVSDQDDSPVSSNVKRVEDWVNSLDDLPSQKPHWDDPEDTSSSCEFACNESETSELATLNSIIFESLSPEAITANLCGIGMRVVPFLGTFTSLRSLSLSGNSIVKISPGCLPKNLHDLDLSKNRISTIEGLRNLTRLRVLNLSNNRISRIGQGLSNCTSIRELYLSGNKISQVEGLHRLRKLFLLDLSSNKLVTRPSLMQLAANYNTLQVLNLLQNSVLLNHGEDQLRRFISTVAPHIKYLNQQPIKAVPAREHSGAVGNFGHGRKAARISPGSKAKRVESLQARSLSSRRRYAH